MKRLLSKTWIWVALASILFVGLRLYYLLVVGPSSLNQDEAALLLNARFLVEAGTDEWGKQWPVVFQSFGDAKLPGYIYTVALLGKIFGFSSWIVRVPSVIAGLILPGLIFAVTRRWWKSQYVALAATFLFMISPWTWHYGTIGFEANMGLALFLFGIYLVWKKTASWMTDILATGVFSLAAFTYNTPWILLPVLGVALVAHRWGDWKRIVRIGVLLFAVFAGVWGATASAATQKRAITIFQDPTILQMYPDYRAGFSGIFQTVLGNKYVYFGQLALNRWVSSWSWEFLVQQGGANPWHSIPGVGHLHTAIPGLAIVGVVLLLARLWQRRRMQTSIALLWLLVMSTLPAFLTVDAPHATRSLFFFVMITVFAGYGLYALYDGMCQRYSSQTWLWNAIRAGFVVFLVWGFSWWWVPAQIRWQRMINPKWNAGFAEALLDQRVQEAPAVYIWDPSGNRYPYVAQSENMSATEFMGSVRRSEPDVVGLVRVEHLGKYSFVFQRSDVTGYTGVYLEPNGNTSWDIIELE